MNRISRLRALLPVSFNAGLYVAAPEFMASLAPWQQALVAVACIVASGVRLWLDTDHSGRISHEEWVAAARRFASALGKDDVARSPAAVALVALVVVMLTACGSTLYVRTSGAGLVEVGANGYPPLRVETNEAASVWWTVGEPTATVEAAAGACVRVRWAGTVLAETCAEADGSGSEAP